MPRIEGGLNHHLMLRARTNNPRRSTDVQRSRAPFQNRMPRLPICSHDAARVRIVRIGGNHGQIWAGCRQGCEERNAPERNAGTRCRSGKGGKGGAVKNSKQAIAIGLSEARKKGAKVPRKASS